MKEYPAMYEELARFMRSQGIKPPFVTNHPDDTFESDSEMMDHYRPVTVEEVDYISEVRQLPEGSLYIYFIEYCFIANVPNWNRLKPLMVRCAELNKMDCITNIIDRMYKGSPSQNTQLFEVAERMFKKRLYEPAAVIYKFLVTSEYNETDRLAASYYRLFKIENMMDVRKAYLARHEYLQYRWLLPDPFALDGLTILIELYMIKKHWRFARRHFKELEQLANSSYSYKIWEDPDYQSEKPLIHYFGKVYLFRAAYAMHRRKIKEAKIWLTKCMNVSINFIDCMEEEGAAQEAELMKQTAQAALLAIEIEKGYAQPSHIEQYAQYLEGRPEHRLKGLTLLLRAVNRHSYDADAHIQRFISTIKFYSIPGEKGWARQHNDGDSPFKDIHTHRCGRLLRKYAFHCIKSKRSREGIRYYAASIRYTFKLFLYGHYRRWKYLFGESGSGVNENREPLFRIG